MSLPSTATIPAGFEIEIPDPDVLWAQQQPHGGWSRPESLGVRCKLRRDRGALAIEVAAGPHGVSRVALRWRRTLPAALSIVGDAWERAYGDLHWAGYRPERPLPWMFLAHDRTRGETWGAGVEVRPGSFACWTVDPHGVTLWLDLRSGDAAVKPGPRVIDAARVRGVRTTARPFAAQGALTGLLCADPLLPDHPLVGANNWYYAYGRDFDAAAVLRDARTVAELAGDHVVRPFGVIDDGWSAGGTSSGRRGSPGPWDRPRRPQFGDLAELATRLRGEGVRPGIWYRPLLLDQAPPEGLRAAHDDAYALDPSHPGTLERVAEDVHRFAGWGFDLLKHDFSTWDAFGRWGSAMGASVTGRPGPPPNEPGPLSGWEAHDRTRTNAEVLIDLYRTIRDAAGAMVLLGCNVVGHLAAGLTHAQRIGDDTSGLVWDRTRRVGVNALAFRLAQHRRFFVADADCVASTTHTDWALQRQFMDLIARSGTALFVSIDPATRNDRVDQDVAGALKIALDGGIPGGVEPLDWLETTTSQRWASSTGELTYDWLGPMGGDPFEWGANNR